MKNVILIGFMGVGKGSVAREVIKNSEYMAIDTDDLIESMENRKIKDIFANEGEAYFRNLKKISLYGYRVVLKILLSQLVAVFIRLKILKK